MKRAAIKSIVKRGIKSGLPMLVAFVLGFNLLLLAACDADTPDGSVSDALDSASNQNGLAPSDNTQPDKQQALLKKLEELEKQKGVEGPALLALLTQLWNEAAYAGPKQHTLDALTKLVKHANPDVAFLAREALKDLDKLQVVEKKKTGKGTLEGSGLTAKAPGSQPDSPADVAFNPAGNPTEEASQAQNALMLPKGMASRALNLKDGQARAQAISELNLYRGDEAVGILLQAMDDPEANNRVLAVNELWRMAADGYDQEGKVMEALRDAMRDPDERVSQLAAKAVADLEKLARQREESQAVTPAIVQAGVQANGQAPVNAPTTEGLSGDELATNSGTANAMGSGNSMRESSGPAVDWEALQEKVTFGGTEKERAEALNLASLYRGPEALPSVLEATKDESRNIRLQATQTLWRLAADEQGQNGDIDHALRQAARDSDEGVAALAQQALDDLQRLEEQRNAPTH